MTGVVDWAASRARMVLAFIAISLLAGGFAYVALPKEGEPDIDIPALFASVEFPGISASDSENLLVKPTETELADLDGLKEMISTAAEGYAGVAMEFEFGWDKTAIMADVRDAMNAAQAFFPDGAEQYTISEINFSEFPIVIVNLTGDVPERTMFRIAKDLQDDLESLDAVLEVGIAGNRDEMVELVIDPLRLEAYNVTANEMANMVRNNNQLIAAGEVETDQGTFSVKIPSSFDEVHDIYSLPVKVNGDRVVTLDDLVEINLTFEDRQGTARFNGEKTVALQVVKRKGYNIIDTVALIKKAIAASELTWPTELQAAIELGTSNDQSLQVRSMVSQLEGSVLTAVALVMVVVLAALGSRAALLVGFAIPTSFLLCFVFLALMGVSISNIVMFGLILAVGMLVDGAIVVVEYADKRIKDGSGPMTAYVEAAQRMFWPIVSSTATTLCAFLPMLFWPGVPGQFMGMLPVTLIFVLSASLIVALIFLPVMGGVTGRFSRILGRLSMWLRLNIRIWFLRFILVLLALFSVFVSIMLVLNPAYLAPAIPVIAIKVGLNGDLGVLGVIGFVVSAFVTSITLGAAEIRWRERRVQAGPRLSPFGWFIKMIVGNPLIPVIAVAAVVFVVLTVFQIFGENNRGVEFFVESEPEQATVYVRARGNISLTEKDEMVRQVENVVMAHPAVINVFSFAGDGGLNTDNSGAAAPPDTIGQVQFEIIPWEDRPKEREPILNGYFQREQIATGYDGDVVIDQLNTQLAELPGFEAEILALARGPASGKPVHLRIMGDRWEDLVTAARATRAKFEATPGLTLIEDSLPLPGIDWQIDVDVEKAGRYGADVATVGAMVQLVTRGIFLDTMRIDSSDEEIEIRVRLPADERVLSTLDTLRVRTTEGLVPLSNFITRTPVPKLASISRVDQTRFYDVKAGVENGLSKIVTENDDGTENRLAIVRLIPEDQPASGLMFENPEGDQFSLLQLEHAATFAEVREVLANGEARFAPITPNERIAVLTEWLNTKPFANAINWEWTGDQEEQEESRAFLVNAFAGALGLMFVILLAHFNSFYNSILVLLAVVLSTTGVLIGMMVMQQPFSIIMTGTGIVALAGIVVNNNIVLIDTYQEYSRYMPQIEAIIRTAQSRIRPVLLTTITTMAGLAPMMFGLSLDFINGGYSIDSPTALWWKQLATAVVFGLGVATVLTLIVTPSLLAIRVWAVAGLYGTFIMARAVGFSEEGRRMREDLRLNRAARRLKSAEVIWEVVPPPSEPEPAPSPEPGPEPEKVKTKTIEGTEFPIPLRAAE